MFRARIVGGGCEDAEMKIDQEMTRRKKRESKGGDKDKEGAMAEGKEKDTVRKDETPDDR